MVSVTLLFLFMYSNSFEKNFQNVDCRLQLPIFSMLSRSTPILSALLLADDLQLRDEKMFAFTPACVSVFFSHLAIVSL